jgi:hypothetical protein
MSPEITAHHARTAPNGSAKPFLGGLLFGTFLTKFEDRPREFGPQRFGELADQRSSV